MKFTSFDKAVLLEKAIILNGIIANGNREEKKQARMQFENEILPCIRDITTTNKNVEEGYPFF